MAANLKTNKYVEDLKQGFKDIQTVAEEGNFKLFVGPIVAVLVVFLGMRYGNGEFAKKVENYKGQVSAIRTEQSSEQEYDSIKMKLMKLEPQFPNIDEKNEWLLGQVLGIFKEINLAPQMDANQNEDTSNANLTVTSIGATVNMGFPLFAKFLAGIENKKELVRVSEFSLTKDSTPGGLGMNKISMKFNTAFPKEKIAKSLFKDYDELIKKQQEQDAAAKTGKTKAAKEG